MKNYYSQTELAERWNVSVATIITRRNNGLIPCFRIGTGKPLYPTDEIHRIEREHTNMHKRKEVQRKPIQRKPAVSVKPLKKFNDKNNEWRID